MPRLLIVGAGLFGSLAAGLARRHGVEVTVFDTALPGAASPAAAGLFREAWAGKRFQEHFRRGLGVLEQRVDIRTVALRHDDGSTESLLFVPPRLILEPEPVRASVTAVGDGWLEADGQRHVGWVYVAAGVWSGQFLPGLKVVGKAGTSFAFAGEQPGQIRPWTHGCQSIAFVRDPGRTHFSDGTAEIAYRDEHEQASLRRAAAWGLVDPVVRNHGVRPYTPGGPTFVRLGARTWLATGGRKMGTLLGASLAQRLLDEMRSGT